ncbi:DegV family protein [Staphylococcus agnetis]|uniref:DegV family protein n=1 Tax=Staphylococcus agnetis TaxID=985762 RepID=UPI00208F945D|nr:DegV family protein [Staphylococcus agnetis]MCO4327837.1 DegV family protein [Staphylococcus agnetis]MCO4353678.1 DegV family protein [Staphylococcus agnetis]MCO4370234.1 DegV family protein [Staphylococcus agnetis]
MGKIAFLTDSTSGIRVDEYDDVFIVSLGTIIDGKEYIDNRDIETDDFYKLLKENGDGAKTFQPSPEAFESAYQEIVKLGYTHVIAIHASKELTGTFNQSQMVSQQFEIKSTVIDSKIGDYPLRRMIEEAIKLKNTNASYDNIVNRILKYTENPKLILSPENLDQLKKSGRLSRSQSIIAGILNIQLVIEFDNGKIYPIKKSRTKKKSWEFIHKKLIKDINNDRPSKIGVSYAGSKEGLEELVNWLKQQFPQKTIDTYPLVPVAGVHTGFGTIAISWIQEF